MRSAESMAELLEGSRSASTAPRLIWYGPGSERIELSGRVLDNWVAKTSNLLIEELDATAGTTVALNAPPHWKTLVWALACWQVGAITHFPSDPGSDPRPAGTTEPDIQVTMRAGQAAPGQLLVVVAPGALDLRWPEPLPAGAVDYAATVRSFGDAYLEPLPAPGAVLAVGSEGELRFSELISQPLPLDDASTALAAAFADSADDAVCLVPASLPLRAVLGAAVQIWARGGTVVLVHPEVEVSDRLLTGERITARLSA